MNIPSCWALLSLICFVHLFILRSRGSCALCVALSHYSLQTTQLGTPLLLPYPQLSRSSPLVSPFSSFPFCIHSLAIAGRFFLTHSLFLLSLSLSHPPSSSHFLSSHLPFCASNPLPRAPLFAASLCCTFVPDRISSSQSACQPRLIVLLFPVSLFRSSDLNELPIAYCFFTPPPPYSQTSHTPPFSLLILFAFCSSHPRP